MAGNEPKLWKSVKKKTLSSLTVMHYLEKWLIYLSLQILYNYLHCLYLKLAWNRDNKISRSGNRLFKLVSKSICMLSSVLLPHKSVSRKTQAPWRQGNLIILLQESIHLFLFSRGYEIRDTAASVGYQGVKWSISQAEK